MMYNRIPAGEYHFDLQKNLFLFPCFQIDL